MTIGSSDTAAVSGGVSIAAVIPAYNREATLGRAIESVLAQTRVPEEIIVVDDGSTDSTVAVAEAYDVTILGISHRGVGAARNAGVGASSADFVAFLDSDDYWHPAHLAEMEQAIRATAARATFYFADLSLSATRGGGTTWGRAGFAIANRLEMAEDGSEWLLLPRQPMMIPASVVARDAYLEVGGSSEEMVCRSDTHLFFRLGLGQPICAVAAVAGEATLDDSRSLTQAFGASDETYLGCTISLYRDVIERSSGLRRSQRKELNRRLAAAEIDLAAGIAHSDPGAAFLHLTRATGRDPRLILRRGRNRLARSLSHRRAPRNEGESLGPRGGDSLAVIENSTARIAASRQVDAEPQASARANP